MMTKFPLPYATLHYTTYRKFDQAKLHNFYVLAVSWDDKAQCTVRGIPECIQQCVLSWSHNSGLKSLYMLKNLTWTPTLQTAIIIYYTVFTTTTSFKMRVPYPNYSTNTSFQMPVPYLKYTITTSFKMPVPCPLHHNYLLPNASAIITTTSQIFPSKFQCHISTTPQLLPHKCQCHNQLHHNYFHLTASAISEQHDYFQMPLPNLNYTTTISSQIILNSLIAL